MQFGKREIGRTGVQVTEYGFGGAPLGNLYAPIAASVRSRVLGSGVSTAPIVG